MTLFEKEIKEQRFALFDTFETNKKQVEDLAKKINADGVKGIAVTARGSSRNACWYFKYLVEMLVGIPVVFINPSILSVYNAKLLFDGFVLFAVSQSGNAKDLLQVVHRAKECGAHTVAVTNTPTSPLATDVDRVLYLNVGEERSVAASKTFTAQMTVFFMLATALESGTAKMPDIAEGMKSVFDQQDKIEEIATALSCVHTNLFVLGRGLSFVSAEEIALKFKETCYLNATSYQLSEFQHGPFAALDKNYFVLLFGNNDPTADSSKKLAKKIKSTGAKLCAFSPDFGLVRESDFGRLLPKCDYLSTPFLQVFSGQLLVSCLSAKKGVNPDSPRNLKKVTVTE